MKGRTIKKVFLLVLLLVSSVAVEGKEDVEIIGRDMDSTGLVSSYTGHDFYISGADAAYLNHICWKYILPSSDGKENVVFQKSDTKDFSIPQIDDASKYHININGDIDAKIVLEGEVRGLKISCVYNLTLELKPRIKSVKVVKIVSNMPKYDSYDVYYDVEYVGSDELFISVEEEYGGAMSSQIIKEPFYAHVKSENITAPYYAWIDISAENKYGKDVYTLELPPYGNVAGINNLQLDDRHFIVRDLYGNRKLSTNSFSSLQSLPAGVYLVEVYSGKTRIKTIKFYRK